MTLRLAFPTAQQAAGSLLTGSLVAGPLVAGSLLAAATLSSCQDDPAGAQPGPTSLAASASGSLPAGQAEAGAPALSGLILEDPHMGGEASAFGLSSVSYGRLVELWGKNRRGAEVRVASEFVIGDAYVGDGQRVRLVSQPILGTDRLMIDEVIDGSPAARQRFLDLAQAAASSMARLSDAGADGAGRRSFVPRNAALVLQFNDLVDPDSISQLGARIMTGSPSIVPFDARLVSHDLIGGIDAATGEFRSTRVIVDFTVSALEARRSEESLAVNPIGLPAPTRGGVPHVELRLPTVEIAGVASPLRSSGGAPLQTAPVQTAPVQTGVGSSAGSIDYAASTVDLVRPFSVPSPTGAYRGFMMDTEAPRLVAEAEVDIVAAPVQDPIQLDVFRLPRVQFAAPGCAGPPQVGDIVSQPGLVAEVIADGGPAVSAGLNDVEVRLLDFPASWTGPEQWSTDGVGVAFYQAPYDVTMDDTRVACLVQVTPTPLGGAAAPTRGVDPAASFQLRFNEPLAASDESELESVLISRSPIAESGPFDPRAVALATGESFGMASLSGGYVVRPEVPLAHVAGASEVYYLTPRTGSQAVRDLAGNLLVESPGPIALSIDPDASSVTSGSLLLGFEGARELGNAGPDVSGQLVSDFDSSQVRARPVLRFQNVLDNGTSALMAQMTPFPQGVTTPHVPLGSRMQTVWRYSDMGLGLADPGTSNIDVEGLYWAPAFGTVIPDEFNFYEIKLSHSQWAPDETVDPASLFPQFQNSGLRATYATNVLTDEAQEVVHPQQLGYTINQGDLVTAPSGTSLIPFPLNRVAGQPKRTFTWRDTTKRQRAGAANGGVDSAAYLNALGQPAPDRPYYRTGEIQTLGLPLLMDFSVFADFSASGQNSMQLNLAVNSSSRPYFRAFTSGGVTQTGAIVVIDPAAETSANGGFSPGSNPPGQQTFGLDNSVMLGAVDFVTRKSVAHTVWIEAGPAAASRQFTQPIVSSPAGQSLATRVSVDIRGALEIAYDNSGDPTVDNDGDENGVVDYLDDAQSLDLYGDFYNEADQASVSHDAAFENPGLIFVSSGSVANDSDWRADASTITGSRFVQLRLTFESDIASGDSAAATAVGIAWTE